ncbi:hypothetical protein KHA94_22875 [Bacillus sp. FJAT-49705]|uniref:Secreted peptide n=1 Tax=Cytobacillus citreus TaxID=2833586 RepID=A0ABS5NYR0_9BACI|nr:hypothetical protein [Cytobacillus citreus]MBS4192962.1 hypothetical protein [Cytobacillus citreus]
MALEVALVSAAAAVLVAVVVVVVVVVVSALTVDCFSFLRKSCTPARNFAGGFLS